MALRNHVSCRTVLWWMVLCGIGVNFMLIVNPNVVIVAIVKPPKKPVVEVQCKINANVTSHDAEDTVKPRSYEFIWNEYEQGLMLGAYYWSHWLTEIPGGILARKYGTKLVFGLGNLLTTLLGLLLPVATKYHIYANISIRVLQGIVGGVVFPSTHAMTAKWIPQNERSKFVSAYMGGGIAIAIPYTMSGYIIEYLGWEAVFYITSFFGLIWYTLWLVLVYDSPAQHPRISQKEKRYILENIEQASQLGSENTSVPWKKIFTSIPVWVSVLSNWSCVWGYNTLLTQAPTYYAFVHGWSIENTGVLAGIPYLLTFVFSWIFGNICDWLLTKEKLTLKNVRKLATFACTGAPALMAIGLSYSGCRPGLAFFCMLTGIALAGTVSAGPLANLVDLSPNYASVLLGICGLIVDAAGFISPIIVGLLTYKNQTIEQWQLIFVISAINMAVGCFIYLIWGSAEQQPWNTSRRTKRDIDDKIMEKVELNT